MGKKKIVIDTNLFISALGWGGSPKRLIDDVIKGKYKLILSTRQLSEIIKVLDYPKFDFTEQQKHKLIVLLYKVSTVLKITKEPKISDDPKDNIILAPADVMQIDYIITGDDDLLRLKVYKKAKIIKIKDFLGI